MRVLSISHRLQHPLIDNHSIFNAPTIFDYDAIVIDVAGVFATVRDAAEARGEFLTHADVPVVNGESVDGMAGIADVLQRRRDEIARALERGATVVVYAAAPSRFGGVLGMQGLDRYFFLPAPDGMSWDASTVRGGEGTHAVVVDHSHPFVAVLETYERNLMYRAYLNDRAPGFARSARVFLRSQGGAPIGVEFAVLRGRVVFMPTPNDPDQDGLRAAEGTAVVAAMQEHLAQGVAETPFWAREITVPGLAEREADLERARGALEQAEAAVVDARDAARERSAIREVLWAAGDSALTAAALVCLEAIGFVAEETPAGDPIVRDGDTPVHLVAAASDEAVGMTAHYRLRQRLDAVLEQRAVAERGLVVASGQRGSHPDERQRELEDALRVGAEATRYAVLPARALFAAALAALEGAPASTLAAVRERIASTDGVVSLDDLLAAPPASGSAAASPSDAQAPAVMSESGATYEDTSGVSGARAGELEAP